MTVEIITGDCRKEMVGRSFDMIVADPPYGDTSLAWDKRVDGWESVAAECLKPTGSIWVFGSMRFFMATAVKFEAAGLRYAQEVVGGYDWPDPREAGHIVWEKHNGSGFHADRFKRVHEFAVQFYRKDAPWDGVYNDVQTTPDAVKRTTRRKRRATHWGKVENAPYVSEDGGPRIMRSVIYMRSMHGRAIHPTEKPAALLEILIRTSCPPGGIVGDFFAGSGSAGEAAAITGRNYLGCEIDADMADAARNRLGGSLFAGAAA